ncbi:MAG: UDP-glucose/GDP-mannose dehydrogenase family protein [Alphaproteobacteria bacterium]|nr:UDP-glucose/GDP-mannose dehydrogenase family protein [Alphaproteobacteria bacterium]MCB9974457.1 UDP-glucose/GDP-mannose dehydrogenase family protein [Rhodospirillales bacterium]
MRIAMVGTGYVGLVSGTCFAEFGHTVVCVDKDEKKIESLKEGKIPIFEPGLEDLLERQIESGRIEFTTDIKAALKDVQAVFIAVGTPSRRYGRDADLSYVYDAAREIAQNIDGYTVVVNKSTVPVGTGEEVERIIREERPEAEFDVASNPEFLREGAAIEDFMRPDRVVVGVTSQKAQDVMREIYRPLNLNETPILFTSRETAEVIKYAANAFLATKITFINEVADLCEKVGADVQQVAKGIGLDGRIGGKFLHAGPGYGGSCFPKDTLALARAGQKFSAPQRIVETVVAVNEDRKARMADKVIDALDGNVRGKKIGILGVAFKPNTDDMRDAPSLTIIPILQQAGAGIAAYDPEAMGHAKTMIEDVEWGNNPYEVAKDADALVIVTEWNEFRALDLNRLAQTMKTRCIIDLRNIYKIPEMAEKNFHYVSIGRKEVPRDARPALKKASGA